MKGKCDEELNKFSSKSSNLGLVLVNKEEFLLPFEESSRTLLDYQKLSKTKEKYPRRIEIIRKDYS